MRLLFSSVLALGLVGAVAGCGHMAGVCDTEYSCGCGGGASAMPVDEDAPVVPTPAMKPEAIQKMPKGDS